MEDRHIGRSLASFLAGMIIDTNGPSVVFIQVNAPKEISVSREGSLMDEHTCPLRSSLILTSSSFDGPYLDGIYFIT
jgi:hypothetical protein